MPQPPSTRLYHRLARILRIPVKAMTRHTWSGGENIPTGAFIAASNHMTNVDPLITAHFLYDNDVAPRIMAKSSLFTVPVLGWAMRETGQIPVYRGTAQAGDALVAARRALANGECVLVFPEGTLNQRVSARLGALAERLRKFTPTARVVDVKPDDAKAGDVKPEESSPRKDE